jgi:hypothetical protein
MAVEQPPPDVLAMILADTVLHEPSSGKFFIQGTYSVIWASEFPYTHPSLVTYLAITGGHGKTRMRLSLVDVDEVREPVFQGEGDLEFPDPIAVVEMVLVRRNVVFPEPGEYRLQLYGAGQFLRERRLQVVPMPGRTEH